MSGAITTGLSALLAAQRALQTTSNNIANANTAGYVRQRVELLERPGLPVGNFTIGTGVAVGDITRVYDQFLTDNLRSTTSMEQRYQAFGDFATRLDTILGNPDTGVGAAVQRFFDQVEAVGRDPTSIAQRQQLLLEGDSLATRLQQLDVQLAGIGNEIDGRLANAADTINQLAGQVAELNGQIMAAGQGAPSDLLDKRDELLKNLGGQIDITTIRQADGSVNVLVGSGQSLVLGNRSARMLTVPDTYDASRLQLAVDGGGGPQVISTKVNGGVVGGLLAFRNDVLDGARNDLGQLAVGLAAAFNDQHRQGMDLRGNLGQDFFTTAAPRTAEAATNTGGATLAATITDASAIEGKDYELRWSGAAWTVLDRQTGAAVAATGAGTGASPLQFRGLSVVADTSGGALAAGDRFLVRPVADAASRLGIALTDPAEIAAAAPLVGRANAANASQATIGAPVVTDVTDPKLRTTAQIVFDSPTSYVVFTGGGLDLVGPLPYTSGGDISFAGWTVKVSGQPQTNDRFTVSAAAAGSGDNSNIQALGEVAQQGFFNGGTQSIADVGADIVATVGATANRAENELKVQQALKEQAELDVASVSGVNLDEEAADMLRYQQAYLAASKVISIADGLFQNLIQIVGR
jgi:flagellar hook-associated protein 1 FlgK